MADWVVGFGVFEIDVPGAIAGVVTGLIVAGVFIAYMARRHKRL